MNRELMWFVLDVELLYKYSRCIYIYRCMCVCGYKYKYVEDVAVAIERDSGRLFHWERGSEWSATFDCQTPLGSAKKKKRNREKILKKF